MKISAKEWLVIFTELVIAIIISLFSPQLIYFLSKNYISFFVEAIIIGVIIIISIILIVFIIYMRIGEIDKVLDEQEIKQKRLEEKFKISLADKGLFIISSNKL